MTSALRKVPLTAVRSGVAEGQNRAGHEVWRGQFGVAASGRGILNTASQLDAPEREHLRVRVDIRVDRRITRKRLRCVGQ